MFWRRLYSRKTREQDLERELQAHLELEAEERGDSYAAHRALGNSGLIKEDVRAAWGWIWLERLWQDLCYAARVLRKSPGFALVAILSLALGIGANTALFSALDAVMWKSLAVRDPDQLRFVTTVAPDAARNVPVHGHSGHSAVDPKTGLQSRSSFGYSTFSNLRDHLPQFSDVIGFADADFTLTATGASEFAYGWMVSGNYFTALGVHPAAGRLIVPADEALNRAPVIVLMYSYWEKRFALNPQMIGQEVIINQTPATIIGVVPPDFQGLDPGQHADMFVPLSTSRIAEQDWYSTTDPYEWWVQICGRLRRGETDASVAARAQAAFVAAVESYAGEPAKLDMPRVIVSPGAKGIDIFRSHQDSLYVLAAVVAIVLLIACANLASLMLARAQTRRREIAVRLSIGASRKRLIRQLLTESLVLSIAAGGFGALLANPLLKLVLRAIGGGTVMNAAVDGRALLFTLGMSIVTGVLFGILPALRATRVDLNPELKDGGATIGRDSRLTASRILVAAQVGFSILMLAGAGLFVRTLLNLMSVDLGFRTGGILTFRTDPSHSGYSKERLADVYTRMKSGIESIPGVAAVGMSRHGLLENGSSSDGFYMPGDEKATGEVYTHPCSDSFLSTMRIPILRGRDLSPKDGSGAPKVGVVNETFVRRFLSGADPVGKVVVLGDPRRQKPDDPSYEIVGVAKDAHYTSVRAEIPPTIYYPYVQNLSYLRQMTVVIRADAPPLTVASSVRKVVARIDPTIPVMQLRTMDDQASENIARDRLLTELISGFGIVAALLAAIGIFGIMAYTVARRTREIGIRLALGATTAGVRYMVLRETVIIVLAGLAMGVPAAFALSKLVATLLYGVKPHDLWSYFAAAFLMAAIGAAAAWLPARRASRVDPMVALRTE